MSMARCDAAVLEGVAALEQRDQLLEDPRHPLRLVALDGDLVAPHDDVGVGEGALDQAEPLVAAGPRSWAMRSLPEMLIFTSS